MSILNLSPEQQKAATLHDGLRTVVATAGAGKTTTLAHGIVDRIINGSRELDILATTFTREASGGLKARIDSVLGRTSKVRTGTIHSFCISLISRFPVLCGFVKRPKTVTSGWYEKELTKQVCRAANVKGLKDLVDVDIDYVMRWMAELDVRKFSNNLKDRDSRLSGRDIPSWGRQAWVRYHERATSEGAQSYDDILTNALTILRSGDEGVIHSLPKYVYIDEAQDLSVIQWLIIEELEKHAISLDVIGDDDQSIYGWRGAMPWRFRSFADRSERIDLAANRRSNTEIVRLAQDIIEKIPNERRLAKDLSSVRGVGGKLAFSVVRFKDSYRIAARKIKERVNEGRLYKDFAFISRSSGGNRSDGIFGLLQQALVAEGVPFRVVGGGGRILERRESLLLKSLAFLSLPTKEESIIQWEDLMGEVGVTVQAADNIGNEAKSLSKKSGAKLGAEHFRMAIKSSGVAQSSKSAMDGLINVIHNMRANPRSTLSDLRSLPLVANLIKSVIEEESQKLVKEREKEKTKGSADCDALVEAEINKRTDTFDKIHQSIIGLSLGDAAARLDLDFGESGGEGGNVVTITTAHGSKGLEWLFVYVVEANQRAWPSNGAQKDIKSGLSQEAILDLMDEERRVLYVAVTRARDELTLLSSADREDRTEINRPSDFLPEWLRAAVGDTFEKVIAEGTSKRVGLTPPATPSN